VLGDSVVDDKITEGEAKEQLEAMLHESEQLHAALSRAFTLTHNIVGLFLPAAIGLFVLGAKEFHETIGIDVLALILAAIFCTARLYADTLWTEVLAYWKYNYTDLQPRIYARTRQRACRNLGQTLVDGWPCASTFPMLVFHIVTFAFVAAITVYGVMTYSCGRREVVLLSCVILLLAVATTSAIMTGIQTKRVSTAVVRSFGSGGEQMSQNSAAPAD
jgi:hypothetical protein